MRVQSIIILAALLVFSSCKKKEEENPKLGGRLIDAETGLAVSNGDVDLYKEVSEDGVVSSAGVFVGSDQTSNAGQFTFNVERELVQSFELRFSHPMYFGIDHYVNPDNVFNQENFHEDFIIQPRIWVTTNIENTGSTSANDEIRFSYPNADFPCACCNDDEVVLLGAMVDTSFTCMLPSAVDLPYSYKVYEEGVLVENEVGFLQTLPLDTVFIDITY